MNPGVTEEVAKVATTTVEALRQTPLILALVVFNVIFMLAMVYISVRSSSRWDGELERMHALVAKVMTSCGPSQPR